MGVKPEAPQAFGTPRVALSECLELAAVRYNAETIRAPIVRELEAHVQLVPVCPEVGMGLGVPRDPIRLVRLEGHLRLHQPFTDRDLTGAVADFAESFLDGLGEVDGFLLKSRSPSCGIRDAKVYDAPGESAARVGRDSGRFAAAVLERFPDLPVEDEIRLAKRHIRQHWLTRVFAFATLRGVIASGSIAELMRFHASYELVLMAYSRGAIRALGRLLANPAGRPFDAVAGGYRAGFARAMRRRAGMGRHMDVIEHVRGRIMTGPTLREKRQFDALLADYRNDEVALGAVLAVLRSWIGRCGEGSLMAQRYLEPYPAGLEMSRNCDHPGPVRAHAVDAAWHGARTAAETRPYRLKR